MREIKFKAKTIIGEKWVTGHLMYWGGNYQIWETEKDGETHNYQVIPETVGQYTGLKDKNGVEIYEGDIVKILYNQNSDNYAGTNFNYSEHVCSVEFGEYSSRFALRNLTEKYKGRHNFTTIGLDHRRLQRDLIEVIGNIHSNPELLK